MEWKGDEGYVGKWKGEKWRKVCYLEKEYSSLVGRTQKPQANTSQQTGKHAGPCLAAQGTQAAACHEQLPSPLPDLDKV